MTLGEQKSWVGFKLRSSSSSLWLHLTAIALERSLRVHTESGHCTPSKLLCLFSSEDRACAGTNFVNKKANIFLLHSLMYIVF